MRRLSLMLTLTLVLASLFVPQAASARAGCGLGGGRVNWIDSNANSRLISAELGTDARLRARATALGPWERFEFVCLDGANACPPEDSGGPGGYEDLLRVLGDPSHEEHEHLRGWIGDGFDPREFDLALANARLQAVR